MTLNEVISSKKTLINKLSNLKKSLEKNNDFKTKQYIGHQLLGLAEYNNDLGEEVDSITTEEYMYTVRYFNKYNGQRIVVEDDDTGNTKLITANTLFNVIDDLLYDLD